MPFRPSLALALVGIGAPSIYLYSEHLRLLRRYPSHPIPRHLTTSRRTDTPAVGMNPSDKDQEKEWKRTQVGDLWQAFVPRKIVLPNSAGGKTKEEEQQEMLDNFVRAYWDSWPLRLEKRLATFAMRIGLGPFRSREEWSDPKVEKGSCQPGESLIGGFFMIEARTPQSASLSNETEVDATNIATPSSYPITGPLVTSWRLNGRRLDSHSTSPPSPAPTDSEPPKLATQLTEESKKSELLGGYHLFAIQPLPAFPSSSAANSSHPHDIDHGAPEEQLVRLVFTSELAMHQPGQGRFGERRGLGLIESTEVEGLTWSQNLVMKFHRLYSRILLDRAVKGLEVEARKVASGGVRKSE